MRRCLLVRVAMILGVMALVAAGCSKDSSGTADGGAEGGADGGADGAPEVVLSVLSTRADMVTGGDALIGVELPTGTALGDLEFVVGDRDVSEAFAERDGSVMGLVEGLPEGESVLEARRGDAMVAAIQVVDHPNTGPIFSGPHQQPFVCTTADLGLGEPTDADCSAPVNVSYVYFTDDETADAQPLDDPTTLPDDVATIDRDGERVPFVVRVEKGVINRSIYVIEVLDPTATSSGDDEWDAAGWNGRLVYEYGGGCGTGYTQGHLLGHDTSRDLMALGYANVTSTLNVFQTACNDVLSAETTMMVKEYFTERYGVPVHTIGTGGSGGAIQQHLITQNYPGLLDAIEPALPFPDAVTIAAGVTDCGLLADYWGSEVGATFTDEQRLAVQGHGGPAFCQTWISSFLKAVNPARGCAADIPPDAIYEATSNPTGARCTLQDSGANLFPKDPATGFAERPLDNVGVQYGLAALLDGTISPEQFLDLNGAIGSYDIDGEHVSARVPAPTDVLEAAYTKGRVLRGDGNLQRIPIITANPYTDLGVDIHDRFRAFSVRDRMSGNAAVHPTNNVLWTRPGKGITELLKSESLPIAEMVGRLDEWLTALDEARSKRADPESDAEWQTLLGETRPDGLSDDCITSSGERLAANDVYDTENACTEEYVVHGDPRTAAGAPRRNDVIKCQLRPIDVAGYGVEFTDEEAIRLTAVFPDGVCDYSKPSVGDVPLEGTWLSY